MIRIGAEPFSNTTMEEKSLKDKIFLLRFGIAIWMRNFGINDDDEFTAEEMEDALECYFDFLEEEFKKLFQETIEQAMPDKWKNVMGMSYRIGYNEAIEEYRENLLKAIGEAGEK